MASYKQRKELWLERARQIDERNAILARNRWHPFASLPHHELIEIPHHRIVQIESTTQQAGTSTRGELTKSQSAFDGEEARRDGAAGSASVPHKDHRDSLSSEPQGLEAGAQPPAAADPLDAHEEGEEGEEGEESVESVKCREAASKWKEQMDKQLDSRTSASQSLGGEQVLRPTASEIEVQTMGGGGCMAHALAEFGRLRVGGAGQGHAQRAHRHQARAAPAGQPQLPESARRRRGRRLAPFARRGRRQGARLPLQEAQAEAAHESGGGAKQGARVRTGQRHREALSSRGLPSVGCD